MTDDCQPLFRQPTGFPVSGPLSLSPSQVNLTASCSSSLKAHLASYKKGKFSGSPRKLPRSTCLVYVSHTPGWVSVGDTEWCHSPICHPKPCTVGAARSFLFCTLRMDKIDPQVKRRKFGLSCPREVFPNLPPAPQDAGVRS